MDKQIANTDPSKTDLEALLRIFSIEHKNALQLCWIIREGIRKNIKPNRIKCYADWYYENKLEPLLKIESEYIFPILGIQNDLVKKALVKHRRLKKLFVENIQIEKSLNGIEEELEELMRVSEKKIFNEVKTCPAFIRISVIKELWPSKKNYGDWEDIFW